MKISTHKHLINKSKITKDQKQTIMMQCVSDFKRHDVDTLDELYPLVCKNVVYAPIHWDNNYRKIANASLDGVDLIVYDSDDGDTEEEILEMFDGVEIMLLQTAGWTPELEKYRIFVPLAEPVDFDSPEDYTAFYRWLGDLVGLHYDKSTTECGRGYIGLKGKEGIVNEGERLHVNDAWAAEKKLVDKKRARQQLRREMEAEKLKATRERQGYKVPTPWDLYNNDKRFKELSLQCGDGNNFTTVFKILGYCKFRGMTASEAADTVMLLNLGSEYSDKKALEARYRKLK